jgi:hypothetical protein
MLKRSDFKECNAALTAIFDFRFLINKGKRLEFANVARRFGASASRTPGKRVASKRRNRAVEAVDDERIESSEAVGTSVVRTRFPTSRLRKE